MFDAHHFHIEATLETTDADKLSTFLIIFTKNEIYSPKLAVTLLQVFPNLFPCVYFHKNAIFIINVIGRWSVGNEKYHLYS